MSAKIISYADGHLDAPGQGGFDRTERLSANSVEALRSLHKTIDTANETQADIVLVPGDLFDSGNPSAEIVARVDEEFSRMETAKAVFMDGNHDQTGVLAGHRTPIQSYFADKSWCAGARATPGIVEVSGIVVATLPWIRVSNSNALGATNEALEHYLEELAEEVSKAGSVSILSGHVTLAECSFDSGRRGSEINMGTSTLEASIPVAKVDEGPWSVARFGHIHKRQQLSDRTGYTGSPYKVSFGETNDDKGVDIITLHDDNTAEVEFRKFDVRELVKIDLTNPASPTSFSARPGDIVRLIANEDTLERAEALSRTFAASGASAHIHRVPKEMAAIQREARYSTEMAPREAMDAFLEKRGVEASKRPAIMAAFSDVSAACSH